VACGHPVEEQLHARRIDLGQHQGVEHPISWTERAEGMDVLARQHPLDHRTQRPAAPAAAALDWLRGQPGLERLPVVTLGTVIGSTMVLWAAALDAPIAGCIELCCAAEYDTQLANGGFDGHGEYFFMPGLLREFTLAEIAALIAPRAHLSLAASANPLTPLAGLASPDRALREAHAALGMPDAWQQHVEDAGHAETAAMRAAILSGLDRFTPEGDPLMTVCPIALAVGWEKCPARLPCVH